MSDIVRPTSKLIPLEVTRNDDQPSQADEPHDDDNDSEEVVETRNTTDVGSTRPTRKAGVDGQMIRRLREERF